MNWIGNNKFIMLPLSSPLKLTHDGSNSDIRVGKRVEVVPAKNEEITLDFDIHISDASMMDLVKIIYDKEGDGTVVVKVLLFCLWKRLL